MDSPEGWVAALKNKAAKCMMQLIHDGADAVEVQMVREGHLPLSPIVLTVAGKPIVRIRVEVQKRLGEHYARLVVEDRRAG